MQKSEKYFIFSWKELTVIALLLIIIVGFFFTLGLHYGKKLGAGMAPEGHEDVHQVEGAHDGHAVDTHGDGHSGSHSGSGSEEGHGSKLEKSPETLPPRANLDGASEHTEAAVQDSIIAATHEELDVSGLKVLEPKAVDLPSDKVKAKPKKIAVPTAKKENQKEDKYSIQLGSYPSKKEADLRISSLKKKSLHPSIMSAHVKGKTHYRVILPGYESVAEATAKAKALQKQNKIKNYIVINSAP